MKIKHITTVAAIASIFALTACNNVGGTSHSKINQNSLMLHDINEEVEAELQCHYLDASYTELNLPVKIIVRGSLEQNQYFLANQIQNKNIKYCAAINNDVALDGLGVKLNGKTYPIVYKDITNDIQKNLPLVNLQVNILRNLSQMLSLKDHPDKFNQYKVDYTRQTVYLLIPDQNDPLGSLKEVELHVSGNSNVYNEIPSDYNEAVSNLEEYLRANLPGIINDTQAKLVSEFITRYDQQAGMPFLIGNLSYSVEYNQSAGSVSGTKPRVQILVNPNKDGSVTLTYRYANAKKGLIMLKGGEYKHQFVTSASLPLHLSWEDETSKKIKVLINEKPFEELHLFATITGNLDSTTPLEDKLINSFILNSFNSTFYLTDKTYTSSDKFALKTMP